MNLSIILRDLRTRRSQTFLVILGAILISVSYALFSAFGTQVSLTADRSLSDYWRTTYDLLVRAPDSVTEIEREYGMVRANHLSGTDGGITPNQWEQIKSIPEVEVAAPIAMLGYIPRSRVIIGIQDRFPSGIYQVTAQVTVEDGDRSLIYERAEPYYTNFGFYYSNLRMQNPELAQRYSDHGDVLGLGTSGDPADTGWYGFPVWTPAFNDKALIAAIDPEQEAKLLHLDEMVSTGVYLKSELPLMMSKRGSNPLIPALINRQDYIAEQISIRIEQVGDLPPQDYPYDWFLDIPDKAWLEEAPKKLVWEAEFPLKREWVNTSSILVVKNGESYARPKGLYVDLDGGLYAPAPVQYRRMNDLPMNLPSGRLVVEAVPIGLTEDGGEYDPDMLLSDRKRELADAAEWQRPSEVNYRDLKPWLKPLLSMEPAITGVLDLDPMKALGGASPNQVPLETYLAPGVRMMYAENGQALDPPVEMRPTLNEEGYLVSPPDLLIPLDQVPHLFDKGCKIYEPNQEFPSFTIKQVACEPEREDYISAVRVVVGGIETMDGAAQAKIERVAQEIVERTGLHVDIMVGSSPEPVLVHLPGYGDVPGRGYVEELWVKKNVSTRVQSGLNRADGLLFGGMLAACLLFLFNGSYLSMLGRMGEFGLLKAVGWRGRTLVGLLLGEGLGMGLLAGLLAAGMVWGTGRLFGLSMDLQQLLGLIPLGGLVFGLGLLLPAYQAGRLAPVAAMKAGETASRTPHRKPGLPRAGSSFLGYALSGLLRRPGRTFFSLLGLALGSGMLALLALVLQGMQGELYGTLLGMWIRTQIQPYHWLMGGVGLVVSAFGVAEILLLNLRERRGEIGLLSAIGWRRGDLFRLFLVEGALLGLSGGLLGLLLGLGVHALLGSGLSGVKGGLLLGVGVALPVGVTLLATLYPAARAARLLPLDALRGEERLSSERPVRAYLVYGGLGVVLLGLVLYGTGQAWQGRVQATPPPAAVILTATPTPTLPPPKPWVEPTPVNLENLPQYEIKIYAEPLSLDKDQIRIEETIREVNDTGQELKDLFLTLTVNIPGYDEEPQRVLDILEARVNGRAAGVELEREYAVAHLSLSQPIQAGDQVEIAISSRLELEPFRDGGDGSIKLRSFYPMLSLPLNEQPQAATCGWCIKPIVNSFTANISRLSIVVPPGWEVAANGEKKTVVKSRVMNFSTGVAEEYASTHFYRPIIARDLALEFGPAYEVESLEVKSVRLSVYFNPDETPAETAREVISLAGKALQIYGTWFGAYPASTLNFVLKPSMVTSASAYPGLIYLYYEEGEDYTQAVQRGVARQWWSGTVGNDALLEPWLGEVLGEYSFLLLQEEDEGRETVEQALNQYQNDVQAAEVGSGRKYLVGSPVSAFEDAVTYQTIIRGKGVLFLDTLRREVGAQAFMDGLRQYAQWYWYGEGSGQGLLEAMQAASGKDLRPLFDEWVGLKYLRQSS